MSQVSLSDDLERMVSPGVEGSDRRPTDTPKEWRARLDVDPVAGGYLVSLPRTAGDLPDAADLLADFHLDPNAWRVTGLRRSRWQTYHGEWLEAARVTLAPAETASEASDVDAQQLIDELSKWRPKASQKAVSGPLAYVVPVGDTQYGKDAGDGTEGTLRRMTGALQAAVDRHRELVRIGRPIGTIVLPQLGDCIEGSTSQNGKVLGRSDLTVTQQVRIGRRILLAWVKAFAPLAEHIIVPTVPGNHDEPHRIVISDAVDSWQLEVVAAVQDACAENPALANVSFRYPERDSATLAVDVNGTLLGMAHGHQARDLPGWWTKQAAGRTPVGAADVLLTAHFHHFTARQVGPRLWIQVPAMDGGSPWFRDRHGLESPTGLATFVIGDGHDPRRDLSVIAGETR